MQTHRLFSTAATILGLTCTAARADIYMELGINKRFFQTSATALKFDHGELNLYLRDGNIILAPCTSDPELFFYPPHLTCPLGITGFIALGDINRDGISDANQYYSIDSVVPAIAIAPNYPQLCSLVSAPPSKLPRPLKIFRDGAVTVFHDLRTAQVVQYNLSLYEMVRRYGSVRQVETVVTAGSVQVSGNLIIQVTGVDFPAPVQVPVPVTVTIDQNGFIVPVFAEEWAQNARIALQANAEVSAIYSIGGSQNAITFTEIIPNGNDSTLEVRILGTESAAEAPTATTTTNALPLLSTNTVQGTVVTSGAAALKQMNEELVTGRYIFAFPSKQSPTTIPVNMPVTIVPNVEALGSNARQTKTGFRFTSGNFDQGFYQMDPRTLSTLTWTGNDATNIVPGDRIYFSILNTAQDRIEFPPTVPETPTILANPAVQAYTLPPGFFDIGDEKVIDLRYQRQLGVTAVTYDRSKREYRMNVRFVDSYPGYAQTAFPLGNSGNNAPTADFDGDGMINIEEYAYQFPTNAEITAAAKAQFVPQGGVIFIEQEEFNRVIEQELEPVAEETLTPSGPIGPELDAENHVVFKVPFRAHTGTSLKYEFVENTTNNRGKVRSKKIKPGTKWLVSYEDGATVNRLVHVEVINRDPQTREVISIEIRPQPMPVTVTQKYIVLRSANPVDPADPLPTLGIKLTPVSIN